MKKKYFIISIICIVILCICLMPILFQNDTFYTIKIGDYIVHNGIDMQDHFSIHILPYTYPHWLYDCIIYLIYTIAGLTSLYIFNIITFIVLILLIFYFNYKNCSSKFITLIFTILSIFMLSSYIATRAQVISYIVFILEYIFITNYLNKPNKLYLIGLVILSCLLCNMHVAVWPFYFIIFLPFLVEKLIAKILRKDKIFNIEIKDYSHIKYLFLTMLICIIPGFLTPIGNTPFTYLLNTFQGSSQQFIQEHLPPSLGGLITIGAYSLVFVVLIILGKIKLHQLFLIMGLTLMALTSSRHLALYTIFIFPIMAVLTNNIFKKCNLDLDNYVLKYLLSNVGISLISICLIVVLSIYITKDKVFVDDAFYPVQATEYIKDNLDYQNIRLLNEYNYGSYLLFNDIPVFIDSRADLYTKEFNKTKDILQEYMDGNYYQILKDYYITHIIAMKGNKLYEYANLLGDYELIYEDDYFALYSKK